MRPISVSIWSNIFELFICTSQIGFLCSSYILWLLLGYWNYWNFQPSDVLDCSFKGVCRGEWSVGLHLKLLLHSDEGVPSFFQPRALLSSWDTNVSLSALAVHHRSRFIKIRRESLLACDKTNGADTPLRLTRRHSACGRETLNRTDWNFSRRCFSQLFGARLSVPLRTNRRLPAHEWIPNDARGPLLMFISAWFSRKSAARAHRAQQLP